MIRSILSHLGNGFLTRVMLALLDARFKGATIFTVIDGLQTPVYCRGVNVKHTPQGALFYLRCYESRYPVFSGSKSQAERVRVLAYRQVRQRGDGLYVHREELPE